MKGFYLRHLFCEWYLHKCQDEGFRFRTLHFGEVIDVIRICFHVDILAYHYLRIMQDVFIPAIKWNSLSERQFFSPLVQRQVVAIIDCLQIKKNNVLFGFGT